MFVKGDKFPRKFGPPGAIFPRKFGPGGANFRGAKFPVTPAPKSAGAFLHLKLIKKQKGVWLNTKDNNQTFI